MKAQAVELPGLSATLDQLRYHYAGITISEQRPHAFIYFITLANHSEHTVTFLGRKWVITDDEGETEVIEGDGIVGETPRLAPGQTFSYNSYHCTSGNRRVAGSFHGVDEQERHVFTRIAPFRLTVPV